MYSKGSHTMRLIIGIISIVLCLIILIQSCAAGIGNAISPTMGKREEPED